MFRKPYRPEHAQRRDRHPLASLAQAFLYDWHNDPEPQYVITLSGTLAFATRNGEKFTLHPGRSADRRREHWYGASLSMVDDQPWRRYVVLKPSAKDSFIPDDPVAAGG